MAKWYCDSVAGSDGNSGTSRDAPFETLGAITPTNGDVIKLKAGSSWSESADWSAYTDLTVKYYGDIENDGLPVIRGDEVLGSSWDDSTDRADAHTNVYSQSHTVTGGGNNWLCFWEDGVRLLWVDDLAACQSTAGSFTLSGGSNSGIGAATRTLYIHPYGSTDPNSDGNVYEGIVRTYGLVTGDDCTVIGLNGRRCAYNNGAIWTASNSYLVGCMGDGSLRHQILAASGEMYRCFGWSEFNDPTSDEIVLEFYQAAGDGSTATWRECMVYVDQDNIQSAFGGHTSGGTPYASFNTIDCAARGGFINGRNCSVINNIRPYLVNGSTRGSASSVNNWIDPWFTWDSEGYQLVSNILGPFHATQTTSTWNIEGARFYLDVDFALGYPILSFIIFGGSSSQANGVNISRSVLIDASGHDGDNDRRLISCNDLSAPLTLNGVVFVCGDGVEDSYSLVAPAGVFGSASNNVYWPNGANAKVIHEGTERLPSAYLAAVQPSLESGSVVADPEVADPANGDFTLTGSGLPSNAGCERPTASIYKSYMLTIPDTLAAAEAWTIERLLSLPGDAMAEPTFFIDPALDTAEDVVAGAAVSCVRDSVASYFDSNGVRQFATANQIRYDHDPVTGAPLGILREPGVNNICSHSEIQPGAYWPVSSAAITAGQETGKDGTQSLALIEGTGGGSGIAYIRKPVTLSVSTQYTFTFEAQPGATDWFAIGLVGFGIATQVNYFDVANGVIGDEGTAADSTIEPLGDGIYRCSVTVTMDDTDANGDVRLYLAEGNGDINVDRSSATSVYAGAVQFEVGDRATSFMPRDGSEDDAGGREADVITVSDLSWYTANAGSWYFEGDLLYGADGPVAGPLLTIDDGSTADRQIISVDASGNPNFATINSGDSNGASDSSEVIAADTVFRVSARYADDDINAFVDGAESGQDIDASFPLGDTMTTLRLGSDSAGGDVAMHIRKVGHYSAAFDDSVLDALSDGTEPPYTPPTPGGSSGGVDFIQEADFVGWME